MYHVLPPSSILQPPSLPHGPGSLIRASLPAPLPRLPVSVLIAWCMLMCDCLASLPFLVCAAYRDRGWGAAVGARAPRKAERPSRALHIDAPRLVTAGVPLPALSGQSINQSINGAEQRRGGEGGQGCLPRHHGDTWTTQGAAGQGASRSAPRVHVHGPVG